MKIKKILTPLCAGVIAISPTSLITSCHTTEETLSKEIVEDAVKEFYEIAKYPRPTYHLDKIRGYLKTKIESLGYTFNRDNYGNVWFDVPATEGYQDYAKVILEGHMDMVVAGLSEEEAQTTAIVPEYHKDTQTLTSKDHKTSLGSDNGIGLGTIFAVIQNKQVKHGPIRVLITADEEEGMIGASKLSYEVIDSDYLISLDGELPNEGYYRSCQGAMMYKYTKSFTTTAQTCKPYFLRLEGFKGGHSGNQINIGRGNATIMLFAILQQLNDSQCQIISFDHVNSEGKDLKPQTNAIPSLGRICFYTSKTQKDIEDAISKAIDKYKSIYYGEEWDKVSITPIQAGEASYNCISHDDTAKLIKLFTNSEKDGLIFGTLIEDPITKRPLCSCNISPLTINTTGDLELYSYGRSTSINGIDVLNTLMSQRWFNYFPEGVAEKTNSYYPWERHDDDKIQKLAHEGYQSIGIEPTIRDTNGGVEPAMFSILRPTIHQTCLGTNIQDAHSVNETCYLKPLRNTVKVLLYMFERLKF